MAAVTGVAEQTPGAESSRPVGILRSVEVKIKGTLVKPHQGSLEYRRARTEADDFHATRMRRELKIESSRESKSQPAGNDEYEQRIAENASFNTKPMIEKAAYLRSEQRGFAPGYELSDWLWAESEVEALLCKTVAPEHATDVGDDRGDHKTTAA